MTVRVEVVTPCPHGEYRMHQIQGEGNLVLRVCDDISRRSFTEWPPEAIEAAARVLAEKVEGAMKSRTLTRQTATKLAGHWSHDVLAAAWGHITGDKTGGNK